MSTIKLKRYTFIISLRDGLFYKAFSLPLYFFAIFSSLFLLSFSATYYLLKNSKEIEFSIQKKSVQFSRFKEEEAELTRILENFGTYQSAMEMPYSNIISQTIGHSTQTKNDFASKFSPVAVEVKKTERKNLEKVADFHQKKEKLVEALKFISKAENLRHTFAEGVPTGWPIKGGDGRITSTFGERFSPFLMGKTFHTGVDIAASPSTPILALGTGKVTFAGYLSNYGNMVVIQHDFGYSSVYAHCEELLTSVGQTVKKGQVIAKLGISGRTTGYHVHIEVRYKNTPIDPTGFMKNPL